LVYHDEIVNVIALLVVTEESTDVLSARHYVFERLYVDVATSTLQELQEHEKRTSSTMVGQM